MRPVDEASKDRSFVAFRTRLIAAVERRDSAFVLSIVDPRIKNGFGGDDGIAAFKRGWKLPGKSSRFWKEFLTVIKHGGAFDDGGRMFVAPYTFTAWPADIDAFEHHVVFGSDVNLRRRPDPMSEVIAKLSYNIITIESEMLAKSGRSEYPGWFHVKTLGGLRGFVKQDYVRSPIDYRAGFEKKRGVWKMTFFLAGD